MAQLQYKEQKAAVVVDNIIDNPSVIYKQKCQEVQFFQYDCCRKTNQAGKIYGPMEPVILNFRIRVNSPEQSDVYYKFLASNACASFSFLFNASYGEFDRMVGYEDGMVVKGYVTGLKQAYSSEKDDNGQGSQMMLDVEVLICSTVYIGVERNLVEEFIK